MAATRENRSFSQSPEFWAEFDRLRGDMTQAAFLRLLLEAHRSHKQN